MSLLDDVSIVVTPNGYKAGELYAVIPVPTEGANVVINGDFTTDSDWTKGTGWTISGGTANCIGGAGSLNLTQVALETGKRYTVTYTVSNYSTGTIHPIMGGWTHGTYQSSNGTYTEVISNDHASANTTFYMQGKSGFVGSIDNVSVKEYTSADMDVTRATAATRVDENGLVNYAEVIGGDLITDGDFPSGTTAWSFGGGWSLGVDSAEATSGSSGKLSQTNTLNGKYAQVTLTVSNYGGAGLILIDYGSTGSAYITSDGTHTLYGTYDQDTFEIYKSATFSGNVTNISVKEVTRDNVPRIDYTGGGCPHILAEPQRTNVNKYSEDFRQSFYIKDSGVSVGTTNNISPSGESNASQIEVNNNGRIYANVTSDTYASSVFIKAGTFAYFKIGGVNVDLIAGTNAEGTIDYLGSGWFRVGINYTGNRPFQIQAYPDGTYSSHTTYGNYYIWGSQIEAGSYATSYIPTSGGEVTRNQDIFTRDGIRSLINSTEGVLFVEIQGFSNVNLQRIISLSDGDNNVNTVQLGILNSTTNYKLFASVRVNSSYQDGTFMVYDLGAVEPTMVKVAIKYKENDFALWVDGVERVTDTSGSTFSADTLNELAFDRGGGSQKFEGKVKQLQVYTTALTDDQIKQITQ